MTLSVFALTLSQRKKCKVTLYDEVGYIVIIYHIKKESSVMNRCRATRQCRVAVGIS